MTFQNTTLEYVPTKKELFGRSGQPKKANFPFVDMAAQPGTGFIIPADKLAELTSNYCRVAVHKFNQKHGTTFTCNMLTDGSMRVMNPADATSKTVEMSSAEIIDTLRRSVVIAEQHKEQKETASTINSPSKNQFVGWITSFLKPGMSYMFGPEYAHLFADMQTWIAELNGYECELTYNPPQLKIKRS